MQVLALDFDGVICDSAREVYLVGVRAYTSFFPESRLAHELAPGWLTAPESPSASYRAFSELSPLGNRAEDFGVALRAVDLGVEIPDQPAYDAFYRSLDPAWLADFHSRFYEQRAALRDLDLDRWLGLHAPFRRFIEILDRVAEHTRLAIATAKDGTSVRLLLDRFGIAALFDPDLILDKDVGVQKTDHLRQLADRAGVGFSDITFVDDKLNHLQRAAGLGVRTVLAGWGYNSAREHELARSLGIPVATLDDAEQVLRDG
jgi:phosphoglycolate phosphatase-like HAD superfamily hydrolase